MFNGLNDATVQGNTKTVADGTAIVRVLNCEAVTSKQNGLCFIMAVQILAADTNEDPIDSVRKIAINGLTKPGREDMARGNLKGLLAAMMDADPNLSGPCEGYDWQTFADFLVSDGAAAWLQENEKRIEVNSYAKLNQKQEHGYKVWSFAYLPIG